MATMATTTTPRTGAGISPGEGANQEGQARKRRSISRRPLLCMLGSAALSTRVRPALAAAWPTEPITIVVSTNAGGGFDTMARNLAPALSRELGVPVDVLDKPGGAMLLGAKYFLAQPHDGNTLLVAGPAPYWYFDIKKFHAGFDLADFDILNIQWTDKTGIFVPKEGRFQSFRQIIDAIRAKPGTVSCGVVRDSGEFFNSGILLDSLKLPLSAMRLVTYEASAPLRTALAGNQLDFGLVSAEASLGMLGLMKPVAVFNDVPVPELSNAPPVNAVLKADGVTVDFVPSSMRALVTFADLKQKHPDRYGRLHDAYVKVLHDPAFVAKAKKQGIATDWLGSARSLEKVKAAYATFDKYKALLNAQ